MTSEEIRVSESGESRLGNEIAYWLREIAAQLAEVNEYNRTQASTKAKGRDDERIDINRKRTS